jgi:hypothetical protein
MTMAVHASRPLPLHGPLLRARVACTRPWLDAELASGAAPHSRPELALRGAQLAELPRRRRFARSLRRAVASAEGQPPARWPMRGAAVPVSRPAVLEARPVLLALADDLDEMRDPHPQGVALTMRLLSDGSGPLYRPCAPSELRGAAQRARSAL